jgi:hypothetical protein
MSQMKKLININLMKLFHKLPLIIQQLLHKYIFIHMDNKRKNVIDYLELKCNEVDEESKILKFIKENSSIVFPYDFVKKYKEEDIEVYDDLEYGGKYVLHKNKRLYFPKEFSVEEVASTYHNLLIEADNESPHCYETSNFYVQEGM